MSDACHKTKAARWWQVAHLPAWKRPVITSVLQSHDTENIHPAPYLSSRILDIHKSDFSLLCFLPMLPLRCLKACERCGSQYINKREHLQEILACNLSFAVLRAFLLRFVYLHITSIWSYITFKNTTEQKKIGKERRYKNNTNENTCRKNNFTVLGIFSGEM